jgi:hypothetical protein
VIRSSSDYWSAGNFVSVTAFLPSISTVRAEPGGLIAYGDVFAEQFLQAALYQRSEVIE